MIKYVFKYDNEHISEIEVSGHASSDHGNDIVCASISTAIIVTLNAIEKLSLIKSVKYHLKEGHLDLKVIEYNDIVDSLLQNLEFTLHELKLQYPRKMINKE